MDRDHALDVLKQCFPKASRLRIMSIHVEDGQGHYTSDITRFVVEYEQDGATQRKHVAIKVPTSGKMRSFSESMNSYQREICMYEQVIPRMSKYWGKSLAPAHLHTTESKILVLEDLTARGYKSGEKFPLLDFSLAKSVMNAFAHFHAASHILYEEDANILTDLLKMNGIPFDKMVDVWGSAVLEILKRKKETTLTAKVEAAFSFFKKNENEIKATLDKSNFKFVVLNHGDGRKDNFLFKNAANDEMRVQLVDYQFCFWSSPVFDIICFFTTSVSADVLEAHFDELVDEYLDELRKELRKLKCTITYKKADFDEDFETLKFFLFFGFFYLCVVVGPLNREQIGDSVSSSITNTSCVDLCLKDEEFVHIVYSRLKYFEKLKIFYEF